MQSAAAQTFYSATNTITRVATLRFCVLRGNLTPDDLNPGPPSSVRYGNVVRRIVYSKER